MKTETNFIKFRKYINQWFGPVFKCNLGVYINKQVRESYDYNLGFDPFTENGYTFIFSFSF